MSALLINTCTSSDSSIPVNSATLPPKEIPIKTIYKNLTIQESSGKHYWKNGKVKISKRGAIGKFQIMPIGLREYNRYNKNKFTTNSLYNEWMNKIIGKYLLHHSIRHFYKNGFNVIDSIVLGINAYNYGIRKTKEGKIYYTYCRNIAPTYFKYFLIRRTNNVTNKGTRVLKLSTLKANEVP